MTPANDNTLPPITCDFQLEAVDPELFPTATWRRLLMRRMQSSDLKLRKAISRFLGVSRGMKIDPEQVLIVSSIQEATNVVARCSCRPARP